MPCRKSEKEKRKDIGIEAIVEPGVGALYPRRMWMKKLDDLGKEKKKRIERRTVKRKQQ